jgi:hypothetical protein
MFKSHNVTPFVTDSNGFPFKQGRRNVDEASQVESQLPGPVYPGSIPDFGLMFTEDISKLSEIRNRTGNKRRVIAAAVAQLRVWETQQVPAEFPKFTIDQIYSGAEALMSRQCSGVVHADADNDNDNDDDDEMLGRHKLDMRESGVETYHLCDGALKSFLPYAGLTDREKRKFEKNGNRGSAKIKFFNNSERWQQSQYEAITSGEVTAGYWPFLIFGASPELELYDGNWLCMFNLLNNLTRIRTTPLRVEIIESVKHGMVSGLKENDPLISCPYLTTTSHYVGFNGRRIGNHCPGYKLLNNLEGRQPWPFLQIDEDIGPRSWYEVSESLRTLHDVAEVFDLVVAGIHESGEWATLNRMIYKIECDVDGPAWLSHCHIRVYSKDDFLVRWRRLFASRLEFSSIPGGDVIFQ